MNEPVISKDSFFHDLATTLDTFDVVRLTKYFKKLFASCGNEDGEYFERVDCDGIIELRAKLAESQGSGQLVVLW